jgi:YHS domain-containing protein
MKKLGLALLAAFGVLVAGCDKKPSPSHDHDHDHPHDHTHDHSHGGTGDRIGKLSDPVCGMTVMPDKSKGSRESNGLKFGFCSESCLAAYDKEPKKYAWGHCNCAKTMKDCDCGHCKGKPEPCGCHE